MVIAIDFDGVLCESRFPNIGSSDPQMIRAVKRVQEAGHETILWTCRAGERLSEAVAWCVMHGLCFTSVNDNAPSNKKMFEAEYTQGTRKVYADFYIDDHNPDYSRQSTIELLNGVAKLGTVKHHD